MENVSTYQRKAKVIWRRSHCGTTWQMSLKIPILYNGPPLPFVVNYNLTWVPRVYIPTGPRSVQLCSNYDRLAPKLSASNFFSQITGHRKTLLLPMYSLKLTGSQPSHAESTPALHVYSRHCRIRMSVAAKRQSPRTHSNRSFAVVNLSPRRK